MRIGQCRHPDARLIHLCEWYYNASAESAQREAAQARLAKADAMFQERCKTAGEFIYRTAEDVEGVYLPKLRLSRWRVAA